MSAAPILSFVSPVYKSPDTLPMLIKKLNDVATLLGVSYEIILVDDRSPDNSWEIISSLVRENTFLKGIRLSRNFGQHPAIMAGLSIAKGEWIVVLDCDLQDEPSEIERMYTKALEGFDIVRARRKVRNDSFVKRLSSKIFAVSFKIFTNIKYENEIANYGIYHKKVIDAILGMSDYIKFFPLFVNFVGFKKTSIDVQHNSREGASSYTFSKLISLAFNSIISYSNKPLKLFVKCGLIISIFAFLAGVYIIFNSLMGNISVVGYSSLIVSIWFLSGIIITIIGITGIYVGKIFDQTKERPVFIIDEIHESE